MPRIFNKTALFMFLSLLVTTAVSYADNPPGWPVSLDYTDEDGIQVRILNVSTPIVSDLDLNGQKSVIFSASGQAGSGVGDFLYVLRPDGTMRSGFPKQYLGGTIEYDSLSVGNVTGDAKPEIVFSLRPLNNPDAPKTVFVLDQQGNVLPGWPKTVNEVRNKQIELADIDNDGLNEIIILSGFDYFSNPPEKYTRIYVYKADGSLMSGWPKTLPTIDTTVPNETMAVGDLLADGYKQIVVAASSVNVGSRITILNRSGDQLSQYDFTSQIDKFQPVIGDINHDGLNEIIFGLTFNRYSATGKFCRIYAMKPDGTYLSGFPVQVPNRMVDPSGISLGDFQGNGTLNIVVVLQNPPYSHSIYVYDSTGHVRTGWPYNWTTTDGSGGEYKTTLGDINGDGKVEVLLLQSYSQLSVPPQRLYVINDQGLLPGFPLNLPFGQYNYSTSLTDLNNDGRIDILLPTISLPAWQTSMWAISPFTTSFDPHKLYWPQLGFDAAHSYSFHFPSADNQPPVFNPIYDQQILSTVPLRLNVSATDPENGHLTLSAHMANGDPLTRIGAYFTDAGNGNGTFDWTPTDANTPGVNSINFQATDPEGLYSNKLVNITLISKSRLIAPLIYTAPSALFQWTAINPSATYKLQVGRQAGASDIYNGSQTTNISMMVNGIPTKLNAIYIRLTTYIGAMQAYNDYVLYKATVATAKKIIEDGTGTSTGVSTGTRSSTATGTYTQTMTGTNSQTWSNTWTTTGTGIDTDTWHNTGTNSGTGIDTDTWHNTGTATGSGTNTYTYTPTMTSTGTSTGTVSETHTWSSTGTSSGTNTQTWPNTWTASGTGTGTNTYTPTMTMTGTGTDTYTFTQTWPTTGTSTGTGTNTLSMTASVTRILPPPTQTSTSTGTSTGTNTNTSTPTMTMTGTGTDTYTFTQTWPTTGTSTGTGTNTLSMTASVTRILPPPTQTSTSTGTSTGTRT